MPNRLKELRDRRGWKQAEVAARAATSQQQIANLEKSPRLSADWINRLWPILECAPYDLLADGPFAVPITHVIGLAFGEEAPERIELEAPHDHVAAPPGMTDTENCFAAYVSDDSAAGMYPRGSTVIARRLPDGPVRLAPGAKVVVAHFATDRAGGDVMEVVVGRLDRTHDGELVVLLRHPDRSAPRSILIRAAPAAGEMGERFAVFQATAPEAEIDYRPEGTDQAEILGRVVMAITPE